MRTPKILLQPLFGRRLLRKPRGEGKGRQGWGRRRRMDFLNSSVIFFPLSLYLYLFKFNCTIFFSHSWYFLFLDRVRAKRKIKAIEARLRKSKNYSALPRKAHALVSPTMKLSVLNKSAVSVTMFSYFLALTPICLEYITASRTGSSKGGSGRGVRWWWLRGHGERWRDGCGRCKSTCRSYSMLRFTPPSLTLSLSPFS